MILIKVILFYFKFWQTAVKGFYYVNCNTCKTVILNALECNLSKGNLIKVKYMLFDVN